MPGLAVGIPKERALRPASHEASGDLEGRVGEIDHTVTLLALGFLRREDPSSPGKVHVPCLDREDLLRAAARLPADGEEVSELLRL